MDERLHTTGNAAYLIEKKAREEVTEEAVEEAGSTKEAAPAEEEKATPDKKEK